MPKEPDPHGRVEDEIRELLAATRARAERYASAEYGGKGLGTRLSAIEEALLHLARAIDRRQG